MVMAPKLDCLTAPTALLSTHCFPKAQSENQTLPEFGLADSVLCALNCQTTCISGHRVGSLKQEEKLSHLST